MALWRYDVIALWVGFVCLHTDKVDNHARQCNIENRPSLPPIVADLPHCDIFARGGVCLRPAPPRARCAVYVC